MDGINRCARLVGLSYKRCYVLSNCVSNCVNALITRHLAKYPCGPLSFSFDRYIYRPSAALQMAELYHQLYEYESWHKGKTLVRRRVIQESLDYDDPQPSRIKAHIKTEVVLKRPTKARVIQAFVNYVDNYEFADEYRAYTEALVQWTSVPRPWRGMLIHLRSACGLNHTQIATQVSEWLSEYPLGQYHLFIDDISNMDGAVQPAHLDLQVQLYSYFSERLADHARSTIKFKGSIHGRRDEGSVAYWGNGTVKSGSQDTSSGQTARRIDTFVQSAYELGVTAVVGFAFGDDLWVLVGPQRPTPEAWYAAQLRQGWKTKGLYVSSPETSDFLACTFAPKKTGGYAMVPMPGRIFAKLMWTWREVVDSTRGSYCHQVAEMFLKRYLGFDLMVTFLRWHMTLPKGRDVYIPKLEYKAQDGDGREVDWEVFLMERYNLGLPPRESEALVRSVPHTHTALLFDPWVDAVMRYDLSDPCDRVAV